MRKGMLTALLAAVALSCADTGIVNTGGDNTPNDTLPNTTPPDLNPDTVVPTTQAITADLRIRGAKSDGIYSAHFTAADLRILIDGNEVPFTLHRPDVDVAQKDHAWKFASFELPPGAKVVQVLLAMDPDEGYFATDSEDGRIDAPGLPITFDAMAHLIEARGKVVVELDVERSLVPTAHGVRELLPFYRVDY